MPALTLQSFKSFRAWRDKQRSYIIKNRSLQTIPQLHQFPVFRYYLTSKIAN